jgi:hypothetical protein
LTRDHVCFLAKGVWVVSSTSGSPVRVTQDEALNTSPVWLPGRRSLLYVSGWDVGRDNYQLALRRDGRPEGAPIRLTTGGVECQLLLNPLAGADMKRMLMEVNDDGTTLTLDDGSRWEVNPGDIPTVCTWIPRAELDVRRASGSDMYFYVVKNLEIDVTVRARPVG